MKTRYLSEQVIRDLKKKMVFLGGPRQVGKTTLALNLFSKDCYLNWDFSLDREKLLNYELPDTPVWIFDEIHKYRRWRNYLKGLYDKNRGQKILVTGSARLDLYRFGGDSLQGRYHFLRLHPLSIDELQSKSFTDLESLMKLGGFPEPFFSGNEKEARRWSREYRQRVLRDDISSLETISDLGTAELALMRLPSLVGSPLSINSLSEDLQVSFKTVKRWIEIFERFYAVFRLSPFGSPRIKAVKKEQKHYQYDWSLITEQGARFENLVASHLLKWVNFGEDTEGRDLELRYYRDVEQREVDFVVVESGNPLVFVECKLADKSTSASLRYVKAKFPEVPAYQLTHTRLHDFRTKEGIRVIDAHKGLHEIKGLILGGN